MLDDAAANARWLKERGRSTRPDDVMTTAGGPSGAGSLVCGAGCGCEVAGVAWTVSGSLAALCKSNWLALSHGGEGWRGSGGVVVRGAGSPRVPASLRAIDGVASCGMGGIPESSSNVLFVWRLGAVDNARVEAAGSYAALGSPPLNIMGCANDCCAVYCMADSSGRLGSMTAELAVG